MNGICKYMEISKSDWLLFKERLPLWQERYMEALNYEYIRILNGSEKASEKFHLLEKSIAKELHHPGVCAEVTKQNMLPILVTLINDGIISANDLQSFSPELIETIAHFVRLNSKSIVI